MVGDKAVTALFMARSFLPRRVEGANRQRNPVDEHEPIAKSRARVHELNAKPAVGKC
jgi:hypothetical protein